MWSHRTQGTLGTDTEKTLISLFSEGHSSLDNSLNETKLKLYWHTKRKTIATTVSYG